MVRKAFSFGGTLLVAAAVFFATAGSSQAQRGHFAGAHFGGAHFGGAPFGGFPGGLYHGVYPFRPAYGGYRGWSNPGWYPYRPYWGYYGSYRYYGSYDYPYYDSYSEYDPVYSGSTYQTALVTVTVPADAKVWFDSSTATSATGRVRQFVTPPLAPGRQYTYWVRARWNDNGQEVNQLQPVEVTPGARINVRFPAPPRTEG